MILFLTLHITFALQKKKYIYFFLNEHQTSVSEKDTDVTLKEFALATLLQSFLKCRKFYSTYVGQFWFQKCSSDCSPEIGLLSFNYFKCARPCYKNTIKTVSAALHKYATEIQ